MNTDKLNYIVIDFETANYSQNSACAIGLVRFIDGKETDSCYSLIKPPSSYFISKWTQEIHGISYDDVKDKPKFLEVWNSLVLPFINKTPALPLVAHNASFDMNVIRKCCEYYCIEVPDLKYFDSLAISKKVWPELPSHRLTYLGETFNIVYKAHDALEDSRTCGIIVSLAAQKLKAQNITELLSNCNLQIKNLKNE